MNYSLKMVNNHAIMCCNDGHWLIDTGSPGSFGNSKLIMCGKEYNLSQSYHGLTADSLSKSIYFNVNGLIGVDILNQYNILFDIPNGLISFSEDAFLIKGNRVSIESFMGIPICPISLNGTPLNFFFDTGAQISYCQFESISDFQFIEIFQDFYPGYGEFNTKLYSVKVSLGNKLFDLRCGILPPILASSLMMAETSGIIGNEILVNNKMIYSYANKNLVFV
jgi:hypothetical protein